MRTVPPARLLLAAAPALIAGVVIAGTEPTGATTSERARATAAETTAPAPTAIAGEAVIEPVESDLGRKPWVSISTSSGGTSAELARDGDRQTAWYADEGREGEGEGE